MKNKHFKLLIVTTILLWGSVASTSAQILQPQTTDRQVRVVLDRLTMKTSSFQREIQRNRFEDPNVVAGDRIADLVTSFANAVNSMRSGTNYRNSPSDLSDVLGRASRINMYLDRHTANSTVMSQWTSIRRDVNTLAGFYNVSWNWNQPYPPANNNADYPRNNNYPANNNYGYPNRSGFGSRLTGTYRLNSSLSDNVSTVIDRSVRYGADQSDTLRRSLERRLMSPEMIAIDKNGRTITMASSNRPQVTFEADGTRRTETNARGRTVTTAVTATNSSMTINYLGDRANDFTITFTADRDGRLRVTRRIYTDSGTAVSVSSVYDKINEVADWSQFNTLPQGGQYNAGNTGEFYVPNGTTLTATLRTPVNTRASQAGDRFSMDVVSPDRYRGAVIEGHVGQAANSGRIAGRASLELDMDTITINGRQYAFAGMIDSVSAVNGDSVTVNNEGLIRDRNQTTKTVQRAGIGAVLGALIGAVAGGGEGAAIGAGVGAGVGAGSVLATGRDAIELAPGTTFRITASAPANAGFYRSQ